MTPLIIAYTFIGFAMGCTAATHLNSRLKRVAAFIFMLIFWPIAIALFAVFVPVGAFMEYVWNKKGD